MLASSLILVVVLPDVLLVSQQCHNSHSRSITIPDLSQMTQSRDLLAPDFQKLLTDFNKLLTFGIY